MKMITVERVMEVILDEQSNGLTSSRDLMELTIYTFGRRIAELQRQACAEEIAGEEDTGYKSIANAIKENVENTKLVI